MPETTDNPIDEPAPAAEGLERGTYEIIQSRLKSHAGELRERIEQLNKLRRDVFGAIPTELLSKQRITTANNCTPRDIVPIGDAFLFGYNVHMGLKSVTELADVFAAFTFHDGSFHEADLDLLTDKQFKADFFSLYKYYKDTRFARFHQSGPYLYLVFQTGKSLSDIKAFKFLIDGETLSYVDNRSDHEVRYPPQHDFKWVRTNRDQHRSGTHPHISIEDRVFVETVGGDLTIKVEDNTDDGSGLYEEPVDDPDQKLDDGEFYYSLVGNLILLKIRPFREDAWRYFVFNEKTQTVTRLDSIADACILLPEDQGLIFSNGYYLQTGVHKTFDSGLTDLIFERRVESPNGEDYLYAFYHRTTGDYVLLMYNVIEQEVASPILCSGFSIFPNGQLIYFKSEDSPQKHHGIQIWQTPFVADELASAAGNDQADSYVYKIGNKEIVRAMAESREITNLIDQDDSYAGLYVDIVKKTTDVIDSYFWIRDAQTFNAAEPLESIREAATAAIDEFEKVVRVRRNSQQQFQETTKAARETISSSMSRMFESIDDFVQSLSGLRQVRGKVISLKELKYVDLAAVEALEQEIADNSDRLSHRCVKFLLSEDALTPYADRVSTHRDAIELLETGTEAKALDEEIATVGDELEMLIEIVSNLKIDDATQRTRIIDGISAIYSNLNQTRAALKKKSQALFSVEGAAEFNSQLKLVSQAVANYLDVSETPEKCDEYLTRMMVQIEEIEGRFAEFDDFVVQLAEKREEIYTAFDTRKLQLVEARNKRATALASAADRILKGIRSRVASFKSVDEINSYFSADLMIDKVRDLIAQLQSLDESVKVDDIQSRLKTIREDTIRQLRDKNELYVDGQNIIAFGKHKFSVNVQPLELTTVIKDGQMFYHLSGTNFFEPINDEELIATKDVWDQSIVSENRDVYRGEYLAFQILHSPHIDAAELETLTADELLARVQKFMEPRYAEGYIKGVHDHDASLILHDLLKLHLELGLMKFSPDARALAAMFWLAERQADPAVIERWTARLVSLGAAEKMFGPAAGKAGFVSELAAEITDSKLPGATADSIHEAASYLYSQIAGGESQPWVASQGAFDLCESFLEFVQRQGAKLQLDHTINAAELPVADRYRVVSQWLRSFVDDQSSGLRPKSNPDQEDVTTDEEQNTSDKEIVANPATFITEAASMIVDGTMTTRNVVHLESTRTISGMLGDHPRVNSKTYRLDYNSFLHRLTAYQNRTVPAFESYIDLKKRLVDDRREQLRLNEFKPRVLTSFVRNKLINETYLPMVGANLAKQMGVVGEEKRTDLMGLLLLLSPPGYGKTTLMEYIANRLGITFMKINGPAIGHAVTSLDPTEAPNASAREEVEKLNLALEMGDNVMIYLDDIQHCNPEFLQKFISLCDATRRIEGVFNGKSKTYDLRGRKVAVVMAGNPYTESGEKFQIPDMLASRADTYNLGDVIGENLDVFEMSYLENCLTSNTVLARLNSRSRDDVQSIIKMAADPAAETRTLDGNYSIEEVNEFVSVMKKLLDARDVILRVNQQYIESAAQSDDYRTEPAFKLQGSYRDMNKIAEQVVPVMNDDELQTLLHSHYNNQAQTLTSGAQANLLKLKELMGDLDGEDAERWEDIVRTFQRNLLIGSAGDDDGLGRVIAQMTTFSEGLHEIRKTLKTGVEQIAAQSAGDGNTFEMATMQQMGHAVAELAKFNGTLDDIKGLVGSGVPVAGSTVPPASTGSSPTRITDPIEVEVINKVPTIFLDIIRNQFRVLQTWMEPILKLAEVFPQADGLRQAADVTESNYAELLEKIQRFERDHPDEHES